MFRINVVVIRCAELGRMVDFYERLGLEFVEEQHGSGPVHYSSTSVDGLVLEFYPTGKKVPTVDIRLELSVKSLDRARNDLAGLRHCNNLTQDGEGFEVFDPAGNVIVIRQL